MKFIPNYNEGFPLDRTTIQTNFPIKKVVGECRDHELDSLPPEIREHVHAMRSAAQNAGRSYGASDQSKKYNPTTPTKQIFIDGYSGISLQARRDPVLGWTCYGITFNPSKVIYGHNGRLIDEEQFSRAASVLDNSVFPLLKDPDDWVHIMPGQTEHSRAWWKTVEIPFHTRDPDGAILSAFFRGKHPEINSQPLGKQCESCTFKSANGELVIRIYRKDIELRKKLKRQVSNDQPVLRIEVQLSGSKLEQYLPNATWKIIDGKRRLVSFRAKDLIAAFNDVISKFSGVYTRVPTGCKEHDNKLARHMKWVEFMAGLPLKDQIDHHVQRHLSGNTPASVVNTRSTFGIAARKEAALMSKVSLTDLFSYEAWCHQPVMCCDELEAKMQIKYGRVPSSRCVDEAYGWYSNH